MSTDEIASAVDRLGRAIRQTDARIRYLFLEAESVVTAAREAVAQPSRAEASPG